MKKGFDFLELMIVVCVVSILSAVLIPSILTAKRKAAMASEEEKTEYMELMKKQDPKKYERLKDELDKKRFEELQKKIESEKQ